MSFNQKNKLFLSWLNCVFFTSFVAVPSMDLPCLLINKQGDVSLITESQAEELIAEDQEACISERALWFAYPGLCCAQDKNKKILGAVAEIPAAGWYRIVNCCSFLKELQNESNSQGDDQDLLRSLYSKGPSSYLVSK